MATNIPITLNWGALPPGIKFPDWQTLVNEIAKIVTGYLPGAYTPINYGNTTPTADNQDRPWIRTNVDGSPDRVYVYFNGKWVSPHPITASSSHRAIWVGSLANLYSFDGGDGVDPTVTAPTTTTGAMWEEDQDFRDKIPMGVLAATGQVTSVGATAGALSQSITLAVANIPRHRHEIAIDNGEAEATGDAYDSEGVGHLDADSGTDTIWQPDSTNEVAYTRYYGKAAPDAITVATVPPVRGIYVIKRTARQFFVP